MRPKDFFLLARDSAVAWGDDYASSMGAAIAFYTVFSIAPLLIIVIAVAGFVWGENAIHGEIFRQLSGLVGADGAAGIQSLLSSASRPKQGLVATTVGVAILVWGATLVFAELQSALDRIWKVPALAKKAGIWNMLRARLLSFGLVLGLAFLLLVSLVVSAALALLGHWVGGALPDWQVLLQGLNSMVSLAITTVLFAMIFKFMPQADIAWRDVWIGAIVTAILFEIGKILIGLYVGNSSTISALTAAGSFVVVLIWVYYAAQVFLLGAEFTWAYANRYGSKMSKTATRTTSA
ncbi:MAG TPA: YihY/virulence factor BrkB family protein [Paralcaligenes sp.]|jgi:membrane protein